MEGLVGTCMGDGPKIDTSRENLANLQTRLGKLYREVRLEKVENGFIVVVGCKTFVSKSWAEVWEELGMYWIDPVAAENRWLNNKGAIN